MVSYKSCDKPKKIQGRAENKMIEKGTKFRIKGNVYRGRIFECVSVDDTNDNPALYNYECQDENGDTFYFSQVNIDYYGPSIQILYSDKLAKAKAALNSNHVNSVIVALEEETETTRYYVAISRANGIQHKYQVKFWSDSESRFGHCNCAAGSKDVPCRHLLKAAELDSAKYGIDLFIPTVAGYKAHLRAA